MKGMLDTTWPIEYRPTDLGRYASEARPDLGNVLDANRRAPLPTTRRCIAPPWSTCRT